MSIEQRWTRRVWSPLAVVILGALFLLARSEGAAAQGFGKNKVQYRQFHWEILQSPHFDVYFYAGDDSLAATVARIAELANGKLSSDLGHTLSKKVPIIVYDSHNDFQQTNVITELVEEGVGGFTEIFKNRVVIPATGSFEELRHVVVHELTHAFMGDLLYGGILESILGIQSMTRVPMWFSEGLAEYESRGWDAESEMYLRDATVNGYLVPLEFLSGGFLTYKEGQGAISYLVAKYGKGKLVDIVHMIRSSRSMDGVFTKAIGMTVREFNKEWTEVLKKRYWPEIAFRKDAESFGRRLTDHTKDGSYYNMAPALSPRGDKLVYFSDKSQFSSVYLMSSIDGRVLSNLVKAEASDRFESIHFFTSSISWGPSGGRICFVAKSEGEDRIFTYDVEHKRVLKRYGTGCDAASFPSWSPDGGRIVFRGLRKGYADLYLIELATGEVKRLTADRYDERQPSWAPDGKSIVFSSDRNAHLVPSAHPPGFHTFVEYSIFSMELSSRAVRQLVSTGSGDIAPVWGPRGKKLVFVSYLNGAANLYLFDTADSSVVQLTDVLGGVFAPSVSRETGKLCYSQFQKGGWDVFVSIDPVFDNAVRGKLEAKVFSGKKAFKEWLPESVASTVTAVWSDTMVAATGWGSSARDSMELKGAWGAIDTAAVAAASVLDTLELKEIRPYTLSFSPDWVSGAFGYSSVFGLGGAFQLSLSDVLGNHRFYFASDLFYSVEESNFLALYYYLPRRVDLGVGAFHFKNYYYSRTTSLGEEFSEEKFFSERNYGVTALASYPFGKFRRIDADVTHLVIQRELIPLDRGRGGYAPADSERLRFDYGNPVAKPSVTSIGLSLVGDTARWYMFGPSGGSRWMLSYTRSMKTAANSLLFQTVSWDLRKYLHLGRRYSFALRFGGGVSGGKNPQRFTIGGGYTLRGYPDFAFNGSRAVLASAELRFPFISHLGFVWPLPIELGNLRGVAFWDMGKAWDAPDDPLLSEAMKSPSSWLSGNGMNAAFGFGVHTVVSFFVIKVDVAWPTDLSWAGGPRWHVTFGSEY